MSALPLATNYTVGNAVALLLLAAGCGFLTLRALGLVGRARREGVTRRARVTDTIAALVVGVLLVGNLSALIGRATGRDAVASIPAEPTWQDPFGVAVQSNFLASCTKQGAQAPFCRCLFDHLTQRPDANTPQRFAALERRVMPDELDRVLRSAARGCDVEESATRSASAS